jgi:carbonic anhydrase/acetyltransferase-like protein (isoleucine patch superfamily)
MICNCRSPLIVLLFCPTYGGQTAERNRNHAMTDAPDARALLLQYDGHVPRVAHDAFIAPSAQLIGNIQIGSEASIWYGCILRGDVNQIRVGDRSNLQDGVIVHGSPGTSPASIGSDVLVGHGALIHGCDLRDGCFIGMRAVILNNAVVETGALVAAGALVAEDTVVPRGEIWGGMPARKIGMLKPTMAEKMRESVQHYVELGRKHAAAIDAHRSSMA